MDRDWQYVVIWEFRVPAGMEGRFEKAYGPQGAWSRLFGGGEGYLRTELIRDLETTGRYVTLDFWSSKQAYEQFRLANADQYRAIDEQCEALTASESKLGEFGPLNV